MLNLLPAFRTRKPAVRNTNEPDRFWSDPFEDLFKGFSGFETTHAPAVDVKEGKKSVTVKAELPGMERDDIKLTVEDGYLNITAEKKEEKDESHDGYTYCERRYGTYSRTIPVGDVDRDKVDASYKNGVLKVTLPKIAAPEPVKITVQ